MATFAISMINFNTIRDHVVSMLNKDLPESLTYHNVDHTLGVVNQCIIIAEEEGITDEEILLELKIAALYHDTGFLNIYKGHEEKSCELAKKDLPAFGLHKKAIDNICEIIMSTKMPQMPANLLQQIICDADLDYLGRDDFFIISQKLHKEFIKYEIACSEQDWKESRISFLRSHSYFTGSNRKRRDTTKQAHLNYLTILENKY